MMSESDGSSAGLAGKESLEGGNVRTGIFHAHLLFVDARHGAAGISRLLGELPPDVRELMSKPMRETGFYPFRDLVILDRTIARLEGGDFAKTLAELGRFSARSDLEGRGPFPDPQRPHKFFADSARLHRQFQDFGRASYERTGLTSGRIRLSEYSVYSPVYCASAVGYFEEAIRIQGGRDPRARETECTCQGGSICLFEVMWA